MKIDIEKSDASFTTELSVEVDDFSSIPSSKADAHGADQRGVHVSVANCR